MHVKIRLEKSRARYLSHNVGKRGSPEAAEYAAVSAICVLVTSAEFAFSCCVSNAAVPVLARVVDLPISKYFFCHKDYDPVWRSECIRMLPISFSHSSKRKESVLRRLKGRLDRSQKRVRKILQSWPIFPPAPLHIGHVTYFLHSARDILLQIYWNKSICRRNVCIL